MGSDDDVVLPCSFGVDYWLVQLADFFPNFDLCLSVSYDCEPCLALNLKQGGVADCVGQDCALASDSWQGPCRYFRVKIEKYGVCSSGGDCSEIYRFWLQIRSARTDSNSKASFCLSLLDFVAKTVTNSITTAARCSSDCVDHFVASLNYLLATTFQC